MKRALQFGSLRLLAIGWLSSLLAVLSLYPQPKQQKEEHCDNQRQLSAACTPAALKSPLFPVVVVSDNDCSTHASSRSLLNMRRWSESLDNDISELGPHQANDYSHDDKQQGWSSGKSLLTGIHLETPGQRRNNELCAFAMGSSRGLPI